MNSATKDFMMRHLSCILLCWSIFQVHSNEDVESTTLRLEQPRRNKLTSGTTNLAVLEQTLAGLLSSGQKVLGGQLGTNGQAPSGHLGTNAQVQSGQVGTNTHGSKLPSGSLGGVNTLKAPAAPGGCNCPSDYQPVCGSNGQTYNNYCFLSCDSHVHQKECRQTETGWEYRGTISHTKDFRQCTPWVYNTGIYPTSPNTPYDPIQPHSFPSRSLHLARNYCRNPDRDPRGPWCFTGYREPYNFGFCNIPFCQFGGGVRFAYWGPCRPF